MNGQQQGYPEELQIVVDKMEANKEPQFNIDIMVRSYYASKQDAGSGPEPTPVADQQEVEENVGIPKESSIDQDWWNNAGLDRDSYFNEQGNMLPEPVSLTAVDPGWDQIRLEEENAIKAQAALENAESYDSSDISEGEGDGEYATQSIVEANLATEKQKKENIEKASTDYQEFVGNSFAYNSITDEDIEAEAPTLEKYEAYQKSILSGQAKGQELMSYEEYTKQLHGEEYSNSLPSIITAKHNGYESDSMFRDTKIDIAKSEYAEKAKLSPSETKKLRNANVNPAQPESMEPFSTLDGDNNVVSFENEYNNIDPNQAGRVLADGTKLGDTLRKGVEDRLAAQNDVESNIANVKNFVEAFPSYSETSVLGAVVKGSTGLDLGLFLKGDTQKLIEKRAKEDFKLLESNVQKIASEASVIGSQIKNNGALLTKAHEDLKSLGDVRSEIDKLKNGEYTTEAQVKSANQKISSLVNDYTAKFNAFDKYRKAHSTLNNAAVRIGGEMKDLDVDVENLGAFTEFIGDNYAIGTQMAWSAANAAINLGQGFADFAYMANPFGAMSDELIDWAGEDSLTASIVEGLRITAAPFTGGLSLYSGDRRDAMRDAIDGFQENVSSKIEQPPAFSSIKDAGSFAEWAAVTGIAQAPQLALMYATGGTAGLILMGAGAAGTKYNEMEENRETYKESGGLYGIDHSFASMFAVSTFTGVIESLSEKVTLGQLNAAGRVMKNEVFKASGRRGIANYLRNDVFTKDAFRSTLRGGKDLFEEGGSEFLATVGGNALTIASGDKSVGLWDGGLESFVTGAMISSTIKTPSLFRAAVAPFQSKTTSQILNNNLDIIERHRDIASGEIEASKEAKQFAKDIIDEAVHENKLALELDIKRVDVYEDAEKSRLIEIESDNIDLRRKATAIAQDETLDKSQKKEMINDLQTKLNNNLDEKQGIIDKYPEDVVNKKYSETSLGRQPAAKTFEENIEFAKKHSALYGLEVDDTMSPAEIRDYLLAQGESQEDADDGMGADGFILGNKIIINREVAMAKDAVTVGSHELLHGILRKAMGEGAISTQVISQLKRSIGSQWSVVQERIDANYTPEYMAKNPDEYLTLVSDAIAKGEITYQETVFDKLRDSLNEIPIFKKYFPNIKFKTGRDVYRFLREYNKSIHKGALATDIVKATQEGVKATQEGVKRTEAQVKEDGIKPSRTRIKKKGTKVNTKESVYEAVNKLAEGVKTNAEWVKRENINKAVKALEAGGAISNIVRDPSRGMSLKEQNLTIEELRTRLKNFDPEAKRKTGSNESITLIEFVNSNIRFGRMDARLGLAIAAEEAKQTKRIDDTTSEGKQAFEIEAETDVNVQAFEDQDMSMAAQAKRTKLAEQGKSESDRYSGLRTELGLEKPMMDKVRKAVMKTFGTKLPDVNSKKFKAALQKAYRTELKKPIQDMIGKGEVYDAFLAESFPTVFKFLPKETLIQMERNVAPENRIFTKEEKTNISPTEVDKLVSEGKLPKGTNRLSGPTLYTKLPYPGAQKVMAFFRGKNMESTLGYKLVPSTLGTRKDKLAMEMGVELGFDATMETLRDPEVVERRLGILELQGVAQEKNEAAIIGQKIDRDPSIKFSKTNYDNRKTPEVDKIFNENFKETYIYPLGTLGSIFGIKRVPNKQVGKKKSNGEIEKFSTRDLTAPFSKTETYGEAGTRVINSFVDSFPQFRDLIKITMTGGVKGGFFLTVGNFNDQINSTDVKQLNPGKYDYNKGRRFLPSVFKKIGTKDFKDNQDGRLPLLYDFFKAVETHLDSYPQDVWMFEELLLDTGKQQNTLTRILGPMGFYTIDPKTGKPVFNEPVVEEHTDPQNQIGKSLLAAALYGKVDQVWKVVGKSYMQGSLLETDDKKLGDKKLGNTMPDVYFEKIVPRLLSEELNLPNGYSSLVRLAVAGVDPNSIYLIKADMTMAQFFKVDGAKDINQANDLIIKQLSGDISPEFTEIATKLISESVAKDSKVMDQAFKASRSSTKPKGITVLDFDDTLATTKSEVVVIDPSIKQEKLFNGSPRSFEQLGSRTGLIFLASEVREAEAYAESNRGEVKEIYVDKSKIGTEAQLLSKIEELGYSTEDALAYELIDTRFPNSLKQSEINEVIKALKKDGLSGVEYTDGAQVVGKNTKSTVVFDKSAVSEIPIGSRKINAEEFAKQGGDLLAQGFEFDFSEFNKVVDGKTAPLFNKAMKLSGKFGTENMFILTARAPQSAKAIKQFLDAQGLKIPLKNITGLGKSEASAKANWIAEKVGEGYNDFYFADDAMQNVDAVREKLDELQVKNKVQQAKIKFSMNTKRNLNWESKSNVVFDLDAGREKSVKGKTYTANFKVGDNEYAIKLANRSLDVPNPYGLAILRNKSVKGDSVFDLEFALENQADELWEGAGKMGIEGTGRASEVLSIVSNGVMDFIKNNNVEAIGFSSGDTSRTRLYNTLTKFWASKLGWEWTSDSKTFLDLDQDIDVTGGNFMILNPKFSKSVVEAPVANESDFSNRSTEEKNMLNMFDIKGKVQQARIKFSKSGPKKMASIIDESELDLNTILEQSKGVGKDKTFSTAKARQRGKNKGKFKFFVPPSADDFAGLMNSFKGKGKQGDKHHAWFKKNLFDPFSKGIRRHKMVQQQVASDMKNLRKAMPDVRKKLGKKVPGTEYTHEDAIRIYNWSQAGLDIPGLSQTDATALINAVESDAKLLAFAQGVNSISNTPGGMVDPGPHWTGGNIALDLKEALDNARSTNLQQWIENKNIIFSEANMNKIEAVYGSNFREALEDSLYRMETGSTQNVGKDRLLGNFTAWIHGSIGTTMFLNARSAMLQMISNVNFVNWSDNNMLKAAGAFANQKQYWGDVSMIFNSSFLKQRRSGIQTDVNAAELLAQIKDSKNKAKAATAYLLQLGFTPTQVADSFAIATGGATFYRNRMKTYLKEGMTQAEAETKAFEDMMEIAEETQQSTREDKISQQQASPIGKYILAFQNTPMQYNRLIKKAAQDLVNGRGDPKANISRIVYYGGIQNLIFYGLQSALFAALFSDDEEDEITAKKTERVVNGMVDTLLRGSGIGGAVVATVKNVILKFMKESEKMDDGVYYTDPDWGNVVIEGLNISPPIGIKARKIYSGLKTWEYNKDVIDQMSKTDLDNPIYDAAFSVTEAVTNVPLSRVYSKVQNVSESLNAEHDMWKRIAMFLGWNKWSFGIKNQDVVTAKSEVKIIKAEEAVVKAEMKKVAKEVERQAENEVIEEGNLIEQQEERDKGQEDIKCAAVSRSGKRCGKKVKDGGNFCTIHEGAPQKADGEKTQCTHLKSDGKRCKMKTNSKSGKCYYHD